MKAKLFFALLFASFSAFADISFTIQPSTEYENGGPLPATGPGSLTSHRVEYGTCVITGTEIAFGEPISRVVLPMPQLTGKFVAPLGTYCVRAFASNVYGESKAYALGVTGPKPSDGGSIVVLRQGP